MLHNFPPRDSSHGTGEADSAPLTEKQEHFIEAMLASTTITAAASATGISRKTAHEWLKEPRIAETLASARQTVFDESLHTLQVASQYAVAALLRNLKADAPPSQQVKAAEVVLEFAMRHGEFEKLVEDVKELEAAQPKSLRGWPA